jgi:Flp pilus assembly pilin Flp
MKDLLRRIWDDETGHVMVGVPALVAAIGAVVLGYGAAEDGTIAVIGGWILGVGVFATAIAGHRGVDYEVFDRLDKLEK